MNARPLVALAALVSLPFATGCMQDPDEQVAEAAAASTMQSSRNARSNNGVGDVFGKGDCPTPTDAAKIAADEPVVGLYPETCLTKTAEGNSVHLDYNDCTGAFGQVHLRGGIDAVFSAGQACGQIHADVADSGDLSANWAPVDYSANADITAKGDERDIAYKASWAAFTWIGDATGDDDLQVVENVASHCLDVSGKAHSELNQWKLAADLDHIVVCPNACPASGTAHVTADGPLKDRQITVEFDGSDTAKITGTSGHKFDVHLVCDETGSDQSK